MMVNISNTAWFGDSLAQPQHLQIAQIRALENGRPMLRATNTGMTAVLLPNGDRQAVLSAFTRNALVTSVQGAAIIEARGLSSAASAANAAIDHMRDWALGTNGKWVTMGIPSDGSYGIPEGVMFGFPVTTENGEYKIVQGLEIDEFSRDRINFTLNELEEERAAIADMVK